MARPTKMTDKIQSKIELLAKRGFTDVEISQLCDITQQTLNNWKKKHAAFFESLIDWKSQADEKVERALYERACGFEHPEEKVFCNNGEIVTHQTTKKYPPETGAAALWLKNRQPDKWREKIDHDVKGSLTIELIDKVPEE